MRLVWYDKEASFMEKEFTTGIKLVFLENGKEVQEDVKRFLRDKILPKANRWMKDMEAKTLSDNFVINGVVLPTNMKIGLDEYVPIGLEFMGKGSIEQDSKENTPGKVVFSYDLEGEEPYQTNDGDISTRYVNDSEKVTLAMDGFALAKEMLNYGIPVEIRETERVSVNDKGEIKVLLSEERPDIVGKVVDKTGQDFVKFEIEPVELNKEELKKWVKEALREIKKDVIPNYKEAKLVQDYGIPGEYTDYEITVTKLFEQKNGGQIMLETSADSKGEVGYARLVGVVPVDKVNKIFPELGNEYGTFVKNWETKHPQDEVVVENVGKEAMKDEEFQLNWTSKTFSKSNLKKKVSEKQKNNDMEM